MDRYTKAVLTAIAAALVTLSLEHAFSAAQAQTGNCGTSKREPCAVYLVYWNTRGIGKWDNCIEDGKNSC